MNFYLPTKLYSSRNCIQNHSKELASLGTKAFIVTGASSSRINGSLQAVITALTSHSIPYIIYDKIEENPSVETVMEAAKLGINENVDFVIGIGGGSPLDASKAIALMIQNPDLPSSILYQAMELDALPVAAVPTTAGTGSEATPYAILTLHNEKTKRSISHRIFPQLALIDSTYLEFLPPQILANTAVDALGHLIESYINANATLYSKMLCEYGFQLWGGVKDILSQSKPDPSKLEQLMTASTIAGMAISHTGTSLPHGMSYSITYEKGIPHGKAVGIFLAAYLDALPDMELKNRVLQLLDFSDIKAFSSFIKTMIGTVTIGHNDLVLYCDSMIKNKGKLANCPFPVTSSVLEKIYTDSTFISLAE